MSDTPKRYQPSELKDFSRLCLHTIATKPWSLRECAVNYAKAGIRGISVWRDAAQGHPDGFKAAGDLCRNEGLEIVSYVRGGFFAGKDAKARQAAIDDNRKIIEEAAALGAPLIVLVCGAVPGQPLHVSRQQIAEGLAAVLPDAEAAGIRLGIEPLHPMYSDCRSAVNTIKQALDMSLALGSPNIGVTVDVFHVWWDDQVENEILRCGKEGKLFSFHICDWRNQPVDMLNDRGLMGEGIIDVPHLRGVVESTGFDGFNEVEIFSTRWWATDQHAFVEAIKEAYLKKS